MLFTNLFNTITDWTKEVTSNVVDNLKKITDPITTPITEPIKKFIKNTNSTLDNIKNIKNIILPKNKIDRIEAIKVFINTKITETQTQKINLNALKINVGDINNNESYKNT